MTKGGQGGLYRTVDGGTTWTRQLALPYPRLFERDMSFLNDGVGFVVVGSLVNRSVVPTLFGTVDGGQRWEARSLPGGGHHVAGLDFVSESRGWVLLDGATGGMLYATADGGRSWVSLATGSAAAGIDPTDHLEGVRFDDPNQGWIAGWKSGGSGGADPRYYRTADGGASWKVQPLPVAVRGAGPPVYVDPPQRQPDGSFVGGVTLSVGSGTKVEIFSAPDAAGTWNLVLDSPPAQALPSWSVAGGHVVTSRGQALQMSASQAAAMERYALPPGVTGLQLVSASDGLAVVAGASAGEPPLLYGTANGGRSWTVRGPLAAP